MVKRTHCKSYVIWFRPKSPTHRQGFDNTWTCSWKTYQHSWSAIRYGMPSWWGSKNTTLESPIRAQATLSFRFIPPDRAEERKLI